MVLVEDVVTVTVTVVVVNGKLGAWVKVGKAGVTERLWGIIGPWGRLGGSWDLAPYSIYWK